MSVLNTGLLKNSSSYMKTGDIPVNMLLLRKIFISDRSPERRIFHFFKMLLSLQIAVCEMFRRIIAGSGKETV